MICALLIGREGSASFRGKNVSPMLGRPLVEYPLVAAKQASTVGRVYVSTDSPSLSAIARSLDCTVIERPAYLATAQSHGEDAFVHGYKTIRAEMLSNNESIELMVLLFANAATVRAETIDQGVQVLREQPELDSAVTVSCYNMWSPLRARRIGLDGLLHPFVPFEAFGDPSSLNCDRDSQGDVWYADMGLSVVRPRCLEQINAGLLPQKWMGQRIFPLKQWGGLDVDYEWQMPQVEFWLRAHGVVEKRDD
jgi:hypothetical protein